MSVIAKISRKIGQKFKSSKSARLIRNKDGKKVELSVADLLICNSTTTELLRYDIIAYYMAIKDYKNDGVLESDIYLKMLSKKYNSTDKSKNDINQLKTLIESYDKNGYDNESRILLDKNLGIIDGTKRVALALFYGYKTISAIIVDTYYPTRFSIDWFIENNFNKNEIETLTQTGSNVMKEIAEPLSCVIWAPAVSLADEIIEDLKFYGTVCSQKLIEMNEEEYVKTVRDIYAIDDIAEWKIEKKIEYMKGTGTNLVAVDLLPFNPNYRIKKTSGLPLSTVGERIKRALRTKYKTRIDNYFYDIILHIGDNIYQSDYMRKVMNEDL